MFVFLQSHCCRCVKRMAKQQPFIPNGNRSHSCVLGSFLKKKLVVPRPRTALKVFLAVAILFSALFCLMPKWMTENSIDGHVTKLFQPKTSKLKHKLEAFEDETFKSRQLLIDRNCYHGNSSSTTGGYKSLQRLKRSRRIPRLGGRNNWIFFEKNPSNNSLGRTNRTLTTVLEWCPVFKAASTPWMAIFSKLTSALTPHTESLIRKGKITFVKLTRDFRLNVPKLVRQNVNRIVYKMIIVRHPFERLVSAYRDKLERVNGREFYHRKYGHRIAALKGANSTSPSSGNSSVHTLISNILKFRNSRLMEKTQRLELNYKPPTFKEFIDYILSIDPRGMDEHWRPMYLDCNPCQHQFDLILKVETMGQDRNKVLTEILGLDPRSNETRELNSVWNRWTNKASAVNVSAKNNSSKYYFSQLSMKDLISLTRLYALDFLFFNYSSEKYYSMINDSNPIEEYTISKNQQEPK